MFYYWHSVCYMLHTMKQNTNKYQQVLELPYNAVTVKQYALDNNCTVSNIYVQISRNKANFKIVTFQTINFIIPQ